VSPLRGSSCGTGDPHHEDSPPVPGSGDEHGPAVVDGVDGGQVRLQRQAHTQARVAAHGLYLQQGQRQELTGGQGHLRRDALGQFQVLSPHQAQAAEGRKGQAGQVPF